MESLPCCFMLHFYFFIFFSLRLAVWAWAFKVIPNLLTVSVWISCGGYYPGEGTSIIWQRKYIEVTPVWGVSGRNAQVLH